MAVHVASLLRSAKLPSTPEAKVSAHPDHEAMGRRWRAPRALPLGLPERFNSSHQFPKNAGCFAAGHLQSSARGGGVTSTTIDARRKKKLQRESVPERAGQIVAKGSRRVAWPKKPVDVLQGPGFGGQDSGFGIQGTCRRDDRAWVDSIALTGAGAATPLQNCQARSA